MRLAPACLLAVCCLGFPQPAQATFVDFTQVTNGPSNTLTIEGITITSLTENGDPGAAIATTLGVGLGVVGLGSSSSIDALLVVPSGGGYGNHSESRDNEVLFRVDGEINSVTIQPFLSVLQGPPANGLVSSFEMDYRSRAPNEVWSEGYLMLAPGAPLTIDFTHQTPPEMLQMGMQSDFGQYVHFYDYLLTNGFPAATIHYGYSILSMDYTPNVVPEPTTGALLGLGLLLLSVSRR